MQYFCEEPAFRKVGGASGENPTREFAMLLLRSVAPNFCESRVIGEAAWVTTRRFDISVDWRRWQFEFGPKNNSENGSNQSTLLLLRLEGCALYSCAPPPR